MQTSNVFVSLGLIGLAFGLSPAASFDGTRTPETAPVAIPLPDGAGRDAARASPLGPAARDIGRATPLVPVAPRAPSALVPQGPAAAAARVAPSPFEALRSGTQALRDGRHEQAVTALEYAAGQGVPGAIWKLGRMYSDGDGVDQNKMRAFEYFRNLTKVHAYDQPGTAQARFVANAFVEVGHFYLTGIPGSPVKPDPAVAHEMFRYAASYFGDSDAQFQLGRLYLFGTGTPKDPIQAARWLRLAANKGQRSAQAMLGTMLFKGEDVSRQAAMGLFWLTVAKDAIAKDGAGPDDNWITETYASASAQASDEERALAYRYLENWVRTRRE
jgi:TPR repeat protein